jgi:predicted DNA-binding antitoxin AbrB/MazE fold protein
MTITVDATFENGQLKLKQPVALAEGTAVRVTITPAEESHDPLAGVIGIGDSGRDPLAELVGRFSSGRTDGAANHDKYLYGKRP